jgi:hypothetical protein
MRDVSDYWWVKRGWVARPTNLGPARFDTFAFRAISELLALVARCSKKGITVAIIVLPKSMLEENADGKYSGFD